MYLILFDSNFMTFLIIQFGKCIDILFAFNCRLTIRNWSPFTPASLPVELIAPAVLSLQEMEHVQVKYVAAPRLAHSDDLKCYQNVCDSEYPLNLSLLQKRTEWTLCYVKHDYSKLNTSAKISCGNTLSHQGMDPALISGESEVL